MQRKFKIKPLWFLGICLMTILPPPNYDLCQLNAQITSKFIGKFVAPNTYTMRDLAPATISQIQRSTNFNHNAVTEVTILDNTVVGDVLTLFVLFPNLTTINGGSLEGYLGIAGNVVVANNTTAIPSTPMPENSLLVFTGNVGSGEIATLIAALRTAQPANIILTQQTGTVPNNAFQLQSYLKSFRADKMTGVGNRAFMYCSALTSISLPLATSIEGEAFNACSQLTSVYLLSATSIGNSAFGRCPRLTSVSFGAEITSFGIVMFSGTTVSTNITLHLLNAIEFGTRSGNAWRGYTFSSIVNTP